MSNNRRKFLQLTGSVALGSLLVPRKLQALQDSSFSASSVIDGKRIKEFGLQLYTLRDDLPADPRGVLATVASFGYKQVESYEGPKGMFWGMSNRDFKMYLDDLGMEIISSHCDITKDFEKKVDAAAAVGMKYLIYNWPSQQHTLEEYRKMAATFNQCGTICRKAGIRFANHNYDSSFRLVEGVYPHDILMQETDPGLVDYQMDIYWIVIAGQEPSTWFSKYKGRFRLCHIKDRVKGSTKREDTCDIGKGSFDFPSILHAAKKNGMEYFIVEQEHYPSGTPLEAVKADAEYMKNLKLKGN